MQPQPIGVAGELYIGGVQLARGYLHRPDLTQQVFVANPFSDTAGARLYRSGDLARFRADGAIEYIGRNDSQVKIRGLRIELAEIDTVLSRHPSVDRCVTIVREDRSNDQRLVAYIVLQAAGVLDEKAVRQFLHATLPDYMVPQHLVEMESLPLSSSGKIDYRALPQPKVSGLDQADFIAPANDIEMMLAQVWCEVLELERVSTRDNFFDIGGHSLSATQMLARVRQDLELNVPLRSFFSETTIEGLASLIDRMLTEQLEQLSDQDLEQLIEAERNRVG
jgi:acyl carrier protein